LRPLMLNGAWLLGMVWLTACAWSPSTFTPAADRSANLPGDLPALLALADGLQTQSDASPHDLDRSLAAIEAAREAGSGASYELDWREARGASLLGRSLRDATQRSRLIERALAAGRRATAAASDRIEGHYFLAVALAFDAEDSQELERIEPLVEQAERATTVDASYDDAGPLRLLGKIYLEAPEWPTSIGDKEKAVELLQRAVELSPTGLNRYFLGEALYHDEQLPESHGALRGALEVVGSSSLSEPWRSLAMEYLQEIEMAGFGGGAP
jgi:tetratricopeptide (TPR) repeat protein